MPGTIYFTKLTGSGVGAGADVDREITRAQAVEGDLDVAIGRQRTRGDDQDLLFCKAVLYETVAAGTDVEKPVFVAPGPCRLAKLMLVNAADLAADGTNNMKLELVNKGSDGTGTTVLATFDSATEAFVAFDAVVKPITGSVDLAVADVLSLRKTDAGTGAAVTELLVAVGYTPSP